MSDEHRLAFELGRASDIEIAALESVIEKISVSKRSHEYIRRLMVQGLLVIKILDRIGRKIPEIESAICIEPHKGTVKEFKFRLNVEVTSDQAQSPDEEIWDSVSKISKRNIRKGFLRKLFLHGYWFETLPGRDLNTINIFFGAGEQSQIIREQESPKPSAKNSAKHKLRNLIPS
jgi:hypothetical protein